MDRQGELGKLHTQLALCERLLVNLTETQMRQAIEDYASALEIRLSLLLSGIDAFQANCVNPPPWSTSPTPSAVARCRNAA